jgi:hypothetical protein
MHTIFFGGIAQYYDDNGTLTQDDNVPFVNTIARVTRSADGTMEEYKLPAEMPSLLGAGSEFIHNEDLLHFRNNVLNLDDLTTDTTLVGYIYGGIRSSGANIFFSNNGNQSNASSQIFKVLLKKDIEVGTDDVNEQSTGTLNLSIQPNPADGDVLISYFLKATNRVRLRISDVNGRMLINRILRNQSVGTNAYNPKIKGKGVFFLTLETPYETATRKIILK